MSDIKINSSGGSLFNKSQQALEKNKLDTYSTSFEQVLKSKDRKKLEKVAVDFEEMFVNILLKNMRNTVLKSELSDNSYQKEMYQGMLDNEYAKEIARTKSFGISKLIVDNFEKYVDHDDSENGIDIKG